MALNPSISLQANVPNIGLAAQQGLLSGQQFSQNAAMAPLQQQAAQQQIDIGQQQLDQNNYTQSLQQARLLHASINKLRALPEGESRYATAQKLIPQLASAGIDTAKIDLNAHLDNGTLDSSIAALEPFIAAQEAAKNRANIQQVANAPVRVDGKEMLQVVTLDPNSGATKTSLVPYAGDLLNKTGLTPEELQSQRVDLERQRQNLLLQGEVNRITQTSNLKAQSGAESLAAQEEVKAAVPVLATAAEMAPTISDINRGLELLKQVKTGGAQSQIKSLANYLGVTSSDAGELESLLVGRVNDLLAQQKGVQTDADYARFQKESPNYKTSNDVNIRLLERLRDKSVKYLDRAQRIAEDLRKRTKDPNAFEAQYNDILAAKQAANQPAEEKPAVKQNAATPARKYKVVEE